MIINDAMRRSVLRILAGPFALLLLVRLALAAFGASADTDSDGVDDTLSASFGSVSVVVGIFSTVIGVVRIETVRMATAHPTRNRIAIVRVQTQIDLDSDDDGLEDGA